MAERVINQVKPIEKNLMDNNTLKQNTKSTNTKNQNGEIFKESTKATESKVKIPLDLASNIPGLLFAAIIAIAIIISAYFFSNTSITSAKLTSINFIPLINDFISINFILFIIFASIAIAAILLIGKKSVFKYALIFSTAGYITGIAISLALLPIFDFVVPLVAVAIAIPLGIRYLAKREEEVKYLKEIRSGASGTGRIITVMCVVFALFLLANSFMQKEKITEGFVDEILSMTIGDNVKLGDSFTTQLAGVISTQQGQTVDLILETQELANLNSKNDPDAARLTQKLVDLKTSADSNAYKDQLVKGLNSQNLDIGKELIGKFPIINSLAEFGWLMGPLSALVIMLFIGGVIIKPLTEIIYFILAKFVLK
ncbi:MAG: hypothetical protein WCI04_03630 [archaeon]